jgi:surface antigen
MRVRGMTLAFCLVFGSVALEGPVAGNAATTDRRGGETSRPAKSSASSGRIVKAAVRPRASHAPSSSRAPKIRHAVHYGSGGGLSCVPYARMVTGMQVSGNGGQWWHNAAGLYARGQRPEPGSVMAFRSSGGMSRGHVAVVSRVLGPRHVQIDHANWSGPGVRRGTVMRNANVIDVSEANDWSSVRVQVGHDAGSFGRVYPTYGFIYNRPDSATYFAGVPTRSIGASAGPTWQEVAEAPLGSAAAATPASTGQQRRRR